MSSLFVILILIAAILLILVVLVQNSKGGGLASNFAGSNQIMGVRQTTDFLEKATWYLAGALIVFSILASITIERAPATENNSMLKDQVENANVQTVPAPQNPQPAPSQPTEGQQ